MVIWKGITKLELENLLNEGLSKDDIANKFNVSEKQVRRKLNEYSIKWDRKNKHKDVEYQTCVICGKQYKQTINPGFCSSNCKSRSKNIILSIPKDISILGKNIIELKNSGLTHSEISKILNCSKSSISYYTNFTTKEKGKINHKRLLEEDSIRYKMNKHLDNFKSRIYNKNRIIASTNFRKKIGMAILKFKKRNMVNVENNYSIDEAIQHLGGIKTKCYLTGKEIDLTSDNYCLDHILPVSKGGTNELDNMGITIPEANYSKAALSLDEYLELCKTVLINFGYTVTK